MSNMTKKQVASAFGNQSRLAEALGLTNAAISLWPDVLDQPRQDRVVGAAKRLKIKLPKPDAFPCK